MSHASSSKICKYDVFLSFRGEDTRRNFVSHLYNALEQRGIRTFKDDERLETGKSISDELLKAIQESKFAIVIFSKSYASSKWCLEELAHIIKCKKELEHIVIPVFYDVSPSDVRHQHPPFADSFLQHEEKCKDDKEKVQRWMGAFAEAGKISGYHLQNFKDEAECIKKLVDDIFPKSLQIISPFPESLVGIKSQVEKVTSLLDMESNDVRSIGIWGMGGIGKTEIANSLHQRYRHQFEADCFLGDVGKLHQKNGLTWLQEVVICKLLGEKLTLTSEHEGMNILKNMLRWKKVLFILDDVNHQEQWKFLVGGTEWFGRGSKIILTARDKHLLISHVGDNVYEVQLLSEDEALELFSRHAFREKSPKEDCMELSRQVVNHAGGLPLALKVLGSSFYGRDKKHWRHIIDRLKRIPHKDILGKLRLSFDGLDKDEKELFLDIVFLDIACLTRYDFHLCAELVLRDVGQDFLIDYLIEKSLLSINISNSIVMHNMIREMGENVIREEYDNSRIWLPEEICDLFKGKLITEKVESLCIPKDYYFEDDFLNNSNIFKRMQSLKILIVGDGTFSSNCAITYFPSSLRLIDWPGYPSISLPESFEPSQLVVLCLHRSWLVELWPISKKLSNLKHLDLMNSCELRKTPNFGDVPNLETLNLHGCVNLEEVHPSFGHCRLLTYLSLEGCRKLKKLPKFVCVESLETLNLIECTSLEEFPEICGDMPRLSILYVNSPWIRSLPPSFSSLRNLQLTECEVLESIPDTSQNLRNLSISGCNKVATLPNSLFESQQLGCLGIYRCSGLVNLPISLGVQKKLCLLEIDGCENLKKLPSSIQMKSLQKLKISNSPKLDTFPEIDGDMHYLTQLTLNSTGIREVPSSIGHLRGLEYLYLSGCEDLLSLPDSLCNLMKLQCLYLDGCKKLEMLPENIGDLQDLHILDASETAISQPPPSITKLGKLWKLRFSHEQQFPHSSSFVLNQVSGLSSLTSLDLNNHNILSGLPEDLGSLHSLENLNASGSNISCLPKSFKGLLHLQHLNVQFCQNLNELPGELPPNLRELFADYHLALKSSKNLIICCLKLCRLAISDYGTVSSEQVNVFLQHFLRTCIQCDFHQRACFIISFPGVRIPELFDYDRFKNQNEISIELNPSWYTDKFMGFWISYGPTKLDTRLEATLVCKSDPERKYSLEYNYIPEYSRFEYPFICCAYIPFETLWHASDNKEGKNPNDYYMLEVSEVYREEELCWGIRLEYEKEAMSDAKVCL
ncbi:disease resistance protein Roq1-like [Solanum stenotomum]|uniref:disease resistance protein Roq1-like n=1 Tax=Solanum stenotomum TaxID=172797 RepID=UPI0020D15C83|nr:disease resistance protein Roq1-like [Solanum stenotomum]